MNFRPPIVPVASVEIWPPSTRKLDGSQLISRQFNFVFVFFSALILIFWPSIHAAPTIEGRFCWLGAAILSDVIFVEIFKHICYFPRPNSRQKFRWGRHARSGFPSGHTLPAFLLATLMAHEHPHLAVLWFLGAAIIAGGRYWARAHSLLQIVPSAALGIGFGLFFSLAH